MAVGARRLSGLAVAIVASLALAVPSAHAAACPGADGSAALQPIEVSRGATLCLLNNERASRGIAPLSSQPLLEGVATNYSQAMVDQRFFSHTSPTGEQLLQRLGGYVGTSDTWDIGENLAWGEGNLATPGSIVVGWMNSEGHRANILNASFREIGIGIVPGTPVGSAPNDSATYTTEFGSRSTSAGAPLAAPVPDPSAASAASAGVSTTTAPAAKKASASAKRAIKAQCARLARRTKGSRKVRKARESRCVQRKLRSAARG